MNFNDQGIEGFDVSFWQDDNATPQGIDFDKMKAYGCDFVIIRAGQGQAYDPDFAINWQNARAADIPRAAYWFYDPRIEPTVQARAFTALFANDRPEGRLWIDLEFPTAWGGRYWDWKHWRTMIDAVRAAGFRVGIYTANWWWASQSVGDQAYFGQFPLWVAQYVSDPYYVTLPAPWTGKECMIWQDGTPPVGIEAGVESKEIDHNKFNGGSDAFMAEFGAVIVPPQPPTEVQTMKGKMLNFTVNVRDASGNVVAALRVNDVVYGPVSTASTPRISFNKIYRADGSIFNLGKTCTAVTTNGGTVAYMTLTNESEPTTPPVVPPVVSGVTHTILVNSTGQISVDGAPYE